MKGLKKMRTARNLTQGDLSRKTGINRVVISLYESGKREPVMGNAKKIAEALHCSMEDLMTDGDER